jgi:hypothetical protein
MRGKHAKNAENCGENATKMRSVLPKRDLPKLSSGTGEKKNPILRTRNAQTGGQTSIVTSIIIQSHPKTPKFSSTSKKIQQKAIQQNTNKLQDS